MQYVVILEIDEAELARQWSSDDPAAIDDSIEHACFVANAALDMGTKGMVAHTVRPLSEVIAC